MSYTFLLKKNNAKTTLTGAMGVASGTMVVSSGALFPTAGDFMATIWDKTTYADPSDDAGMEIVKVTAVVGGSSFTISRAQEGTTASVHSSGHNVEHLFTAGQIQEIETQFNTLGAVIAGTTGSVLFIGAGGTPAQDNANFFYDDTNNRLGIGTPTPEAKLEIVSTSEAMRATSSGTGALYNYVNNAGGRYYEGVESAAGGGLFTGGLAYASAFGSGNATAFQLATNNIVRMTILSSGEIGIGMSTPDSNLYVQATGSNVGLKVKGVGTSALQQWINASGDQIMGLSSKGQLSVVAYGLTNGNAVVTMSTSAITGNVYGLNAVMSATGDAFFTIENASSGSAVLQALVDGIGDAIANFAINGVTNWAMGIDNSDSDSFKISEDDDVGTNDRLTILTGGNVGIGTASPGAPLHVVGNIYQSGSGTLYLNYITSYDGTQITIQNGASGMRLLMNATSSFVTFNDHNNASVMKIQENGNVGIGTTAPDKALEINHATGANLRLTYNDSDGSASNYADLSTTSSGDLTIAPSGGDTSVTGTLAASTYFLRSVGNALTASGSSRTDALQLAKEINNVTTAAAGTGVILPVGVIGMRISIFNNGANALQVYASASETIDGTAGSTGVPLTNAKRCEYFFVAANTWISMQGGPVSA